MSATCRCGSTTAMHPPIGLGECMVPILKPPHQPKEHEMANATMEVNLTAKNFIGTLARELREAADRLAPIDRDGSVPAAKEICEHYWAWVSPAGTSNSARVCQFCHKPDADWLNEIQQAPIDRDELKAVIMSCGPDPAAAEVADVVVAWLGER